MPSTQVTLLVKISQYPAFQKPGVTGGLDINGDWTTSPIEEFPLSNDDWTWSGTRSFPVASVRGMRCITVVVAPMGTSFTVTAKDKAGRTLGSTTKKVDKPLESGFGAGLAYTTLSA